MEPLSIVYTIRGCTACARLIEQWGDEGVSYEERRADLSQKTLDEARELGDAVPIIVYPDGRVERRFGGRRGCYIG
jgi:hypothetical protein